MNALFWALQALVIVFALMSFNPVIGVVLIGKTVVQSLFGIHASNLHAIAGGRGILYPPLMLVRESAVWTVAALTFVGTFLIRLWRPA